MTGNNHNHNHGWKSVAKGTLGGGFSFHPKLAIWLEEYTNIPKETELEILEVSCGEASCPTEETMIVWKEHEFRISRKKEKISKMDVDLSWKRFVTKG
ncbi:hypothetical protein ND861_09215 [Leptospira sp. 2 VSF19]|uniref:Uncharacterized protein n=1 Tax=Leptospira soteropolitanensis TaxID=2950025 RepID=A0AAW5VCQ8_9LEPT|nr:hypothetical protein [Leptospira soteropolitanensis]MCW7492617.1 hypothetical protein [Leptospira soteropolitanensis]MCW7500300.1 hypothetical protein [Leptospira soteropolitanensis]MCW7522665.1 hypothetical protein [Leptospira soteropolitanensis]MCW7526521.1 hypothetical protein [Leptospira soteropolitanensis]MCW7530270.1 hypothetical protein [Leptospira soteropolitanensis]